MFWICRSMPSRTERGVHGRDASSRERCFELMRTLLVLFLLSSAALVSTLLAGST
jgi:hypothetical protein